MKTECLWLKVIPQTKLALVKVNDGVYVNSSLSTLILSCAYCFFMVVVLFKNTQKHPCSGTSFTRKRKLTWLQNRCILRHRASYHSHHRTQISSILNNLIGSAVSTSHYPCLTDHKDQGASLLTGTNE